MQILLLGLHVTEGFMQEAACIIRFKTDMIEKKKQQKNFGEQFFKSFSQNPWRKTCKLKC